MALMALSLEEEVAETTIGAEEAVHLAGQAEMVRLLLTGQAEDVLQLLQLQVLLNSSAAPQRHWQAIPRA